MNAVIIGGSYPLPIMDKCIYSLGDATIITTLDANLGYWKVKIEEADFEKTKLSSHNYQ